MLRVEKVVLVGEVISPLTEQVNIGKIDPEYEAAGPQGAFHALFWQVASSKVRPVRGAVLDDVDVVSTEVVFEEFSIFFGLELQGRVDRIYRRGGASDIPNVEEHSEVTHAGGVVQKVGPKIGDDEIRSLAAVYNPLGDARRPAGGPRGPGRRAEGENEAQKAYLGPNEVLSGYVVGPAGGNRHCHLNAKIRRLYVLGLLAVGFVFIGSSIAGRCRNRWRVAAGWVLADFGFLACFAMLSL
jgi:hypothetical protein